jgi:hypothetical protein
MIGWSTNFQGDSAASGYIASGQSASFFFKSATPPPATIIFECGFYDNIGSWGFGFPGVAKRVQPSGPNLTVPIRWQLPVYDPWWWIKTHGGLTPPGPFPDQISHKTRVEILTLAINEVSKVSRAFEAELKQGGSKKSKQEKR